MNNTTTTRGFVAVDPSTGCQLRAATDAEIAAYMNQDSRGEKGSALWNAFLAPVRVGSVLVDEWNGYGTVLDQGGWAWL